MAKRAEVADRLAGEGLDLHRAGRLEAAAARYEAALAEVPGHGSATQLLGALRLQQGRADLALPLLEAAARAAPRNAQIAANLGLALNGAGHHQAALAALDKAVALDPSFDQAHANRGMVLRALRRLDDAEQSYRRAIGLKPQVAGYHFNLGNLLAELGRPGDAESAWREALRLRPGHAGATQSLARHLVAAGESAAALAVIDAGLPGQPPIAAALLLTERGRVIASERQLEAAASAYRAALAADPRLGEAWYELAQLDASGLSEPDRAAAAAVFADAAAPHEARVYAGFAVARALTDLGRDDEAIAAFHAVNALHRARLPFSLPDYLAALDAANACQLALADRAPAVDSTAPPRPVFIVGLPRSGKSTLEAILAGRPDILPAGEQPLLQQLAERHGLNGVFDPGAVEQVTLDRIGRHYIDTLGARAGGRTTLDTMPANIGLVGLILTAMPTARVLWCLRDPAENGIALYEKFLPRRGYDYAYRLDEAIAVAEAWSRLAGAWGEAHGARVRLVRLTSEGELTPADAQAVIGFLGLPPAPIPALAVDSEPRIGARSGAARRAQARRHLAAWERLTPGLQLGHDPDSPW